jgi:hypothetical protein
MPTSPRPDRSVRRLWPRRSDPPPAASDEELKDFRAVAMRTDKREFVYQGTIDVASIKIWLRHPRQSRSGRHALMPGMRGP